MTLLLIYIAVHVIGALAASIVFIRSMADGRPEF